MDLAETALLHVTAPDGRRLRVRTAGAPDGPLVIAHHGSPGSGLALPAAIEDVAARGLRLATVDRAGYGGSDRLAGRSVADMAGDTAAVADALGVERFRVWGWSGGGPHALACAALLPDRVQAVATLGGVAPYDSEGLDWTGGMGAANLEEFGFAVASAAELDTFLAGERDGLVDAEPAHLAELLASLLSAPDRAALDRTTGAFFHASFTEGLRPGHFGWMDDDLAFVKDWGFHPASITAPLLIVHGEQDLMVPVSHARWMARQVPHAVAWISPDDGHISPLPKISRVHEWLLGQDH
ncbi:alpha/beta hydrolase [Fodinicola feengrottensis]|uniref:Alpha/beta hydrolase n=1 Tax=Fodinicola feengrottensis TaxID=435914 RepID=A0ABP4UDR6_9ACTN